MPVETRHHLPHDPTAPAAARDAVEALLADRLGEGPLAKLRLLASELVTNAVLHGFEREGAIELTVSLSDEVVRIEVTDGGRGFDPPADEPAPGEPRGWGLVVVDRLTDRWGVEDGGGTRVWAELELATSATSGGRASAAAAARNV